MTPRPTSHADRSRSRSLIRRESGGSSRSLRAESPVPVPELPNTDGAADSEKNENNEQGVPETSEETVDGQYGKSPLLTTHRPSVVSEMSMDDVSLEEGTLSAIPSSCHPGGGILGSQSGELLAF
jgi:hypothetical protein